MIVKMKMGNNALFSSDAAIVRPEFPNQILLGSNRELVMQIGGREANGVAVFFFPLLV